ncbi:MAG: molybdopterin dinucleotide binding domain-containing protein, partial [bacterium]
FDLSLIGRRQLRSNNSWMHNSERLVKGKARCTLLMHPRDAAARNLENGQMVEVRSRVGKIEIKVEVSDEMMAGVVSIPHGWGHHRPGIELQTASKHAGASINDLTDERLVDPLCGNAALSDVPVRVRAA